jgi:hypothetical protein
LCEASDHKGGKTVDIVLKAIRDLVAEIKLAVADASNISVSELERRLEGNENRLVIASAARRYADQLRVLEVGTAAMTLGSTWTSTTITTCVIPTKAGPSTFNR